MQQISDLQVSDLEFTFKTAIYYKMEKYYFQDKLK